MKRIIIGTICIAAFSISFSSSSQSIDPAQASRVAVSFFAEHLNQLDEHGTQPYKILKTSGVPGYGEPNFYVVQFDPEGWILVNASTSVYPVAAYALQGSWTDAKGPWSMWIDAYKDQMSESRNSTVARSQQVGQVWEHYLQGANTGKGTFKGVQPLLTSTWNQGVPYNAACPIDPNGPGGHAVTGCVATACAQLMYYFRYPQQGSGSYSYVHPVYGTIAADFSTAFYNYDEMLDLATTANPEMAELAYHFGVSVDMVYGPYGSGMYNHKAAYSLRTHFNYSPQTQYVFRDSTTMDWDSLLTTHLHRKIPLYYAGWEAPGSTSGHAFICDGYQTTAQGNFYHFNWGWGGTQDGYFYTNNLTPGGSQFSFAQELIINAFPDTNTYTYPAYCNGLKVLQAKAGTLDDGSGPVYPYAPNSSCTWLIDPQVLPYDSVRYIELKFSRFQTESGVDKLMIYDGADTNAPLIGTYSGNTLPPVIQSTGNKVFMKFVTNDSVQLEGFFLSYKAVHPVWCSGTKTLVAPSGTFDDGSGAKYYNGNSLCRWLIQPPGAQNLSLQFSRFETEAGKDILNVYDWGTQQLLGSYSGNQLPPLITSPGGALFLEFSTSPETNALGWEASYHSSGTGINPHVTKSLSIYPNPGKGKFYIEGDNLRGYYILYVYDTHGRVIRRLNGTAQGETIEIDMNELPDGVYFLTIQEPQGLSFAKLILMR